MGFFFLTDQLEEPEFQKAQECGNNSHTYNFYLESMQLPIFISLPSFLFLMSLHILT